MRYTTILFDLDGTISDTKPGIMNSVRYSLNALGYEAPQLDELERFIGPPIRKSFMDFFGFSEALTEEAVTKYREYYATKGLYENELYPGIKQLLSTLAEEGRALAVATTKAEVYAARILDFLGISRYFSFVAGSELDGRRSDKAELIRYALANLRSGITGAIDTIGDTCDTGNIGNSGDTGSLGIIGDTVAAGVTVAHYAAAYNKRSKDAATHIAGARDIVMIGDRAFDILGAKTNGIDSIGVLYGYGDRAELLGAGADYIAADATELYSLL